MAKISGSDICAIGGARSSAGFRPVDRRCEHPRCSQDVCRRRSRDAGCSSWAALLPARRFSDSAASGVRSWRNVRVQYLGDYANTGRTADGRPLDGLQNFLGNLLASSLRSDRIRRRLTDISRRLRDYAVVALLPLFLLYVIGPVRRSLGKRDPLMEAERIVSFIEATAPFVLNPVYGCRMAAKICLAFRAPRNRFSGQRLALQGRGKMFA